MQAQKTPRDLRGRFFAGDVQHCLALRGKRERELSEECGFADPRFSSHERDGSRHESSAQHAVQRGNRGGQGRGVWLRLQARKRLRRAKALRCSARARCAFHGAIILGERAPFATAFAATLPFGGLRIARRAHKAYRRRGRSFCHVHGVPHAKAERQLRKNVPEKKSSYEKQLTKEGVFDRIQRFTLLLSQLLIQGERRCLKKIQGR